MESKPFSKTNSERLGLSFFLADEIADSYHVNIVVQVFSDIRIEQAGKIIFIIPEHR